MKIHLLFAVLCLINFLYEVEANPVTDAMYRKLLKERLSRVLKKEKFTSKALDEYRLPGDISPTHQLNRFQIFFDNLTFAGYTELSVTCVSPTSSISFHHRRLTIDDATIEVSDDDSGTVFTVTGTSYNSTLEMYTLNVDSALQIGGNYTAKFNFNGDLDGNSVGLYYGTYINQDDQLPHYYAVSDFEPDDARMAFPCLDEPAFKARFTTEIIREDGLNSASNMPLNFSVPEENQPGFTRDVYQTSVPMSTYLNAFYVSDYKHPGVVSNGVSYEIYAVPHFENATDYALFLGPGITQNFEEKFQVPYTLPKQDMIALNEFSSGAMENWGFITYRDEYLLFDPDITSAMGKRFVCEIISHELAHQWFGNLVTMDYWENLWLNEGFATFFENQGCGAVEPDFTQDLVFLDLAMHPAFDYDDSINSNPIIMQFDQPSQFRSAFNTNTYSKGGSLLKMIEGFLTTGTYYRGLNAYLVENQFSNTVQDDLFEALNTQAQTDGTLDPTLTVKMIMDTWTLQPGYPVINVTNNNDGTATLTQQRYLADRLDDPDGITWYVPITYTTQADSNFNQFDVTWMSPDEQTKLIPGIPSDGTWFIFNMQARGFFRVNYETENWNALSAQLNANHAVIDTRNRIQLLNDAYKLAETNRQPYDLPFAMSSYLSNEVEYIPLDITFEEQGYIQKMFRRAADYALLVAYYMSILEPAYNRVGFDDSVNDPLNTQLTRDLVTSWTCELDYEPCRNRSVNLYAQWMSDPDNYKIITPNVRYAVYCSAIAEGGDAEWNFAWGKYLNALFPQERYNLLYALGCSQNTATLNGYLDTAFSDEASIPKADINEVIDAVSYSLVGENVAWNYVVANANAMASYTSWGAVADYARLSSRYFNTEAQKTELVNFRDSNLANLGDDVSVVDAAIDNTQDNIDWMARNYDVIVNWLNVN